MTTDTSETGLESLITLYLVDNNQYILGNAQDYDKGFCLDRAQLLAFLEESQASTLAKIPHHDKLLQRVSDQVRDKGIVEVLRKGIKYQQHRLTLYYPQPPNNLNPEAVQNYQANRFSVTGRSISASQTLANRWIRSSSSTACLSSPLNSKTTSPNKISITPNANTAKTATPKNRSSALPAAWCIWPSMTRKCG